MSESPLVKADEAAKALGVSKSSLFRMASQNVVPSYKVGVRGRGVRFCIEEVLAALRRPKKERTS